MICEIDDLYIYYETHGEGVPVLMLHGFGIDHHVMIGCMEPIFERRPGWKRVYFDLPGMGRTQATARLNNADQMLDVIIRFSEKVIPGDTFLVVGESYGAYLARGLVHTMPEHLGGVLLICPVIIADRERRDLPPRQVFAKDDELLAHVKPDERKQMFERMLVVQDKRRWERFQQDIIPGMIAKDTGFVERFTKSGYSFPFDVDHLERPFDRPSLVLSGRQDATVGYRDSLEIIENYSRGTFGILDRAGHGLEVEQETMFNCMVNEWLDRVEEYEKGRYPARIPGW